jgi:hypothetical protein
VLNKFHLNQQIESMNSKKVCLLAACHCISVAVRRRNGYLSVRVCDHKSIKKTPQFTNTLSHYYIYVLYEIHQIGLQFMLIMLLFLACSFFLTNCVSLFMTLTLPFSDLFYSYFYIPVISINCFLVHSRNFMKI